MIMMKLEEPFKEPFKDPFKDPPKNKDKKKRRQFQVTRMYRCRLLEELRRGGQRPI
jgi:hypothetical protein